MVEKKSEKKIDLVLVSYVLGIISIISAFFMPIQGLVFGIIGYIHSRKSKSEVGKKSKIMNIIGIVLSIILSIAGMLLMLKAGSLQNFPAI